MTNVGKKFSWIMRLFRRLPLVWRLKYRGIRIAGGVTCDVQGSFFYGRSCTIGKYSILVVPGSGSFEMGDASYLGRYVEIGAVGKIKIGENSSLQDRCVILGDVTIGDNCLFSYNVYISSGRHYFDLKPWWLIKDQDKFAAQDKTLASLHSKQVVVEDDCWIGINTVIMPGITIGKGAVIGANSVVTKDVEPYSVIAGSPAKLIKKRIDFIPPKKITYSIAQDLPYFYSGFYTSQNALLSSAVRGGIQAGSKFVISLDTLETRSVHLKIMGIEAKDAKLILNNTYSVAIPEKMSEVIFSLDMPIKNKLFFNVQSSNLDSILIVQEAWVV